MAGAVTVAADGVVKSNWRNALVGIAPVIYLY